MTTIETATLFERVYGRTCRSLRVEDLSFFQSLSQNDKLVKIFTQEQAVETDVFVEVVGQVNCAYSTLNHR